MLKGLKPRVVCKRGLPKNQLTNSDVLASVKVIVRREGGSIV
jgi:hypothetical protein